MTQTQKSEEQSMSVSEMTYRNVALEDPEGHWELACGHLRRKPSMTADHNRIAFELAFRLREQLDRQEFQVRSNSGHVRHTASSYYIPDVLVIPAALERAQRVGRSLEYYQEPMPLVVEVWSPSTGDYDVETKLVEYQRRGDLEIWLVHPYERTVIAWVRQLDGAYRKYTFASGYVHPTALPDVGIDLDTLFD